MSRTSMPCWRPLALALGAVGIWAGTALAQRPVAVQGTAVPDIPILAIAPGDLPPLEEVLEGGQNLRVHKLPGRIKPLTRAEKQAALHHLRKAYDLDPNAPGARGTVRAAPGPRLDQLTLTVRNPYAHELGDLYFYSAYSVSPASDHARIDPKEGLLGIRLKLEAGKSYLLDLAVHGGGIPGTYILKTPSGTHSIDAPTEEHHILVGLNATGSGWTNIRLSREGWWFTFLSVEVTRVQ